MTSKDFWADGVQGGLGFHRPPLSTHNKRKKDIMDLDDYHEFMDRKDLDIELERELNDLDDHHGEGWNDFFVISGPFILGEADEEMECPDGDEPSCEACEDTGGFDDDNGDKLICDECELGKDLNNIQEVLRNERERLEEDDEEIDRFFNGNNN